MTTAAHRLPAAPSAAQVKRQAGELAGEMQAIACRAPAASDYPKKCRQPSRIHP
jgi:hypothetical protein